MMINVGLGGFTMSALRYPSYFRVVEVQQTFYQPPATNVINRWRAQIRRLATMVPADREACVLFNNIPRVGDAERFKFLLDAHALAA